MTQPQKGVCAEPSLHAQYLMFNVIDDDAQVIRAKLAHILDVFEHHDNEHYEAMVSGMIAVGSNYWSELYPGLLPVELAPFPDMHCDDRSAPVSPCDLFVQIRADRADVCYAIGCEVMEILKNHVELFEEVKGFRYLDGRDLHGFIIGSDNPRGMRKREVAIVGDQDPDFAGGSYVHVQRYHVEYERWNRLPVKMQEEIMGRLKESDQPIEPAQLANFSHAAHTANLDPKKPDCGLLQQSMPYGDMSVKGLFFVSCCRSPKPFNNALRSMIFGDQLGNYDRWLDYAVAQTGAAFFAPSLSFIKARSVQ